MQPRVNYFTIHKQSKITDLIEKYVQCQLSVILRGFFITSLGF